MQTSNIKSELNFDNSEYNQDRNSSQNINQLTCCLKDAIFSKYISNYLIEKVEKIWILYEKRIDKFLKDKHLNITCNHIRPQTAIKLEELIKYEQENIDACKRNIEVICSSRKRLRNDDKYSVQLQSTQRPLISYSSTRVPKTPRCIDRSDVTSDVYNDNIDELNDSKSNKIINQELNESSLNSSHHNFRHCLFQHGEILPLDPNTKTRTIRITYRFNDCEDGFDELSTCLQQQYTSTQFQCQNQNCTLISYVCDGIHYCGDNIDENPNQYLSKVFDRVLLRYTTYKIRMFYMTSMENHYNRFSSPQMPQNVQTIMNNIRNFITRSTNNINIGRVLFRNARSTTARDQSTIKPSAVFPSSMFTATITASNQPARLATLSDESAKLNVEVQSSSSKLSPKDLYF
ncbi:unnamed protein product [Rotaria sordida]|uniref:Uncharacterized protein n=1 Tax=Rotaria sordida TaxID=392033 RepID=A0A813NL73_9BILA|nr:unnamed protein product [Rotaria sordida]CAF0741435.1 unnamed protein product [Rotaria sordida]